MVSHRGARAFGIKDFFTMLNLASGVIALDLAFAGRPRQAGYVLIAGFLVGDGLDGAVARATKTANRFGAEFDTVTDHFAHVFVPGLIMYVLYRQAGHGSLGLAALAMLVAAASIRHARFAAAKFEVPYCWCGLPRTVAGFVALSFPLSTTFSPTRQGHIVGALLVGAVAALTVAPIPYRNPHGDLTAHRVVVAAVLLFVATTLLTFVVARRYTFDVVFAWTAGFAFTGWLPFGTEERRMFYVRYREWRAEVMGP